MNYIRADLKRPIPIGRKGENGVTIVQFPINVFFPGFGEATYHLSHIREGDTEPYPCATEVVDGNIEWLVLQPDLARPGAGSLELTAISYVYDGEMVEKSVILVSQVGPSHAEEEDMPEVYQAWLDSLEQYAARAERSADIAQQVEAAVRDDSDIAETARIQASESAASALASMQLAAEANTQAQAAKADAVAARGEAVSSAVAAVEVAPFYAEYGVTTKAEIEAAINNKRQIYLNRGGGLGGVVAPYTGTFLYADIWGEGTGYRFALTNGNFQYVYELKSEWTYSIYDLTAPAQRAEAAADQALIRMNSADTSAQAAAETATTFTEQTVPAAVNTVNEAKADALAAVGNAQTTAVGAVQQESATQQAAIQQKGDDVLESIPSDYTELTEDVNDLKSAFSSSTGNSIVEQSFQKGIFYPLNSAINSIDVNDPNGYNQNIACAYVPCQAGDIFRYTGKGASGARCYAFLSSASGENNIISRASSADSQAGFIDEKIVAPQNAVYVIFNWNVNNDHLIIKNDYLVSQVKNLNSALQFKDVVDALDFSDNANVYETKATEIGLDNNQQKFVIPKLLGSAVWQWNQCNANNISSGSDRDVDFTNNGDGTWTVSGTKGTQRPRIVIQYTNGEYFFTEGHWYLLSSGNEHVSVYGYRYDGTASVGLNGRCLRQVAKAPAQNGAYDVLYLGVDPDYLGEIDVTVRPICVDLTMLFGAGNEPHKDETDLFKAIEAYAAAHPGYSSSTLVEGKVSSIAGSNTISLDPAITGLEGNGWATFNKYNYFSYDRWVEKNVVKSGWRFHKRVGKVVLNGTQAIKKVPHYNTETTSAWLYKNMGEKPEPDNTKVADLISDVLEVIPEKTNHSGNGVTKASISAYTNQAYGFLVRVPITGIETEADVNTYMAAHPATVYYELNTEEIIDVSGLMNEMVLLCGGACTISTDTGVAVPSRIDILKNAMRQQPPMLTIIDDDGDKHFITDVLPLIQRTYAPIATAVTVNNIGHSHFMSYAEIDQCCDGGAEILNHTYDHPAIYSDVNILEETHEYYRALNALLRHGYHSCDILVYTSSTGEYEEWRTCAKKVFKCGIKIGGSRINYSYSDKFALSRYRIDYGVTEDFPDWDYATLQSLVDKCAAEGGWMIWMFHTSNNIYRQRVETDEQGNVIYDQSGNPIPMTDGGNPVIDVDGTYPTMGSVVYIPMLEDAIGYAREKGIEIVTAEYGYKTYFE